MAETTVSQDDIDYAQNYLTQYLRDAGYSGSLEDGTAIYDLVIKGMSLVYTLFKGDLEKVQAYLSLADAEDMADTLGDEYDTAVDSILSNWFVTRNGGSSATGPIRLYFSQPLEYLSFSTDTTVASISGYDFVPTTNQTNTES